MLIMDFLRNNAKEHGEETCLVEVNPELDEKLEWRELPLVETEPGDAYRKEITWKEFDDQANRFANLLLSRGLSKGDKVAILLMNCIEWLPAYFGALKAGAIVVPLNFRYSSEEIQYCLELADAVGLVFGDDFTSRLAPIQPSLKSIRSFFFIGGGEAPPYAEIYEEKTGEMPSADPCIAMDPSELAAIYFSSGTTGLPKAILHNHESLLHACLTEQNHHSQGPGDVFLLIPPLYHTGAKMHWFGSLASATKAVLLKGASPKWILEAASKERATIVWLLVPWAQDILDCLDSGELKLSDYALSQWRLMHIGAQPVPPSLIKRWLRYFPLHQYDTNYGLSESIGPGAVHLGVGNVQKVGAIGKAGFGWKARIVDESVQDVPKGEVGELAVSGPGVMVGYYKDPSATEAVLKDGWLLTGDMAREDEDGFIYLVDRKKDVIIMGGENLYPVQIEDFLRTNDKIKDVAVIGVPDTRLGEIAAAVIELKTGCLAGKEEIDRFCLELPRYKRPRKVIFASVPRNATGKIEKPRLREMYAGGSVVAQQISQE
ncbi:MAG: AMP-binding protein [Eubacteriaceae bacterium]|jgi:acyl-CoA synthetase (AMP-forming)/AMP-acid ligase II|nr:AMP-binding protein [Eubacteriaceae bacterium]